MAIKQIPFNPSGNIADIGWDDETLDLFIEFQKGGLYQYQQVTEEDARGFSDAPSATKYMNTYIETKYIPIRLN